METSGALQPVLNKLSTFFPSETRVYQEGKVARMQKKIQERGIMWDKYADVANTSFSKLYGEYEKSQEKGKVNEQQEEDVQADLVAYLFTANRKQFEAGASTRPYDSEKEKQQIEGVVRALSGHHLHMGTGAGKSTAVLPIAALVDGFTRGKGRVIVGSATGMLTDEIAKNIEGYSLLIQGENGIEAFKKKEIEVKRIESESGGAQKDEKNMHLVKDTLLTGTVGKEIETTQFSEFWDKRIEAANTEDPKKYYELNANPPNKLSIFVAEEKDLVFDWMENRKEFEGQCPRIYMDEAHVPFGKKTPYEKSSSSEGISPEAVRDGMSEWLINYLVAQKLRTPPEGVKYIEPFKGTHVLTDEGAEELHKIHLAEIRWGEKDEVSTSFQRGIDILYESMRLNDGEKSKAAFFQESLDALKRFVPSRQSARKDGVTYRSYVEAVGGRVASMLPQEEKLFTTGADGKNTLRDETIDELLADNQYEPSTQAAVLAIAGKFEPIQRHTAFKTSTYESFVHANKDKMVAFSGTLYVPDPIKQVMKKGSFADFLETETGRSVDMLAASEIKPFPAPRIFTGDKEKSMLSTLIWDLKSETALEGKVRPTLIVETGGLKNAKATYEAFVAQYGADKVKLLPPKPPGSDTESSRQFEKNLEEYRKSLSMGEIEFLVSSGSAALGVNFEKREGGFPDLRTVTIGMPESEEKMAQIIGRRRMKEGSGRNHLWYLTMSDLDESIAHLEKQKPFLDKKIQIDRAYLFGTSQTQMKQALEKAQNDPKKALSLMVDLWHELKKARATDVEQALAYDDFMGNVVVPQAEEYVKRKIAQEMLGVDEAEFNAIYQKYTVDSSAQQDPDAQNALDFERRKKGKMIEYYFGAIGLPSTFYSDIQGFALHTPKRTGGMNFPHDSAINDSFNIVGNTLKQPSDALPGIKEEFGLEGYLDKWYTLGKESGKDYIKRLHIEENLDFCTPENNSMLYYVRQEDINSTLTTKLEKEFAPFEFEGKSARIQVVTFTLPDGAKATTTVLHDLSDDNRYILMDHLNNPIYVEGDVSALENMMLKKAATPLHYKNGEKEYMALHIKAKR